MMKIGSRKSMAYYSLLCIPFLVCLFLPAMKSEHNMSKAFYLEESFVFTTVLLTSILNGFGIGVNQPAAGNYISDCASEKTKGFYFAFFWSFFMGSQIVGNLIGAYVLGSFD